MKRTISVVLLLVLLIGSAGCTNTSPKGIGRVGNKTYYTIIMTETERESYFTTADPVNQMAVTYYGKTGISVVNWSPVSGGGWIAWIENRVRYFPETFTEKEVKTACSTLSSDDEGMSIQTAAKYVPQLEGAR